MAITASSPRRRSFVNYFPALLIGALATVIVTAVALRSSGSNENQPPVDRPAARWFQTQDATPPVYMMYIVDSQEAAAAVRLSEDELIITYINTNQQAPNRTSTVLVATTPEEGVQAERLANLAAEEMVLTNTVFQVIDLRGQ